MKDLIQALKFVISPVPYITALFGIYQKFEGICLWDSLMSLD